MSYWSIQVIIFQMKDMCIKAAINSEYNEYIIEKALSKPIHMLKNDKKVIAKLEQDIKNKQEKLQNANQSIYDEVLSMLTY